MTGRVAIITDSTCDIPREWRQEYDLSIVPLTIIWGQEQFLDGVDLSAEEFYARLVIDPLFPTTSQPAPQLFLDAYLEAARKGYHEILVITISGAMSGTIESARQAANASPIPVQIMDSRNNSMGLGWQVIAAARARQAGGDLHAMQAAAEAVRDKVAFYITLDTMEYLSRGGRIGDAVKFLGSLLKIKPTIFVKTKTGTVGASIPARSRKGAVDGLINQVFGQVDPNRPVHMAVLHNAAWDEAEALAERVRQQYNPIELVTCIVSPILGVHTGPKALALCGYNEP